MMRWTKELPTEPGWYWLRYSTDDRAPWIVHVRKIGMGTIEMYCVGHEEPHSIGRGCQWAGPIEKPEEEEA